VDVLCEVGCVPPGMVCVCLCVCVCVCVCMCECVLRARGCAV